MRSSSTSRAAAVLAFTLAAALAAIGLFVAFRDTSAARALAAPAAELPFTNDNFDAPGFIMPPPSPPGAGILPWDGSQTTVGATLEQGETAPCGNIGSTVWFYYQPDHTGTLGDQHRRQRLRYGPRGVHLRQRLPAVAARRQPQRRRMQRRRGRRNVVRELPAHALRALLHPGRRQRRRGRQPAPAPAVQPRVPAIERRLHQRR